VNAEAGTTSDKTAHPGRETTLAALIADLRARGIAADFQGGSAGADDDSCVTSGDTSGTADGALSASSSISSLVSGISYDSRRVAAGDLFLALPGTRTDGARYAADAIRDGAVAVLCSREAAESLPAGVPAVVVDDVLRAAGLAASAYYGRPADRMKMVGVTGTNGKTSCTYLLDSVWRSLGVRAGISGTISARWPGVEKNASMTTPAVVDLQAVLAEMAAAGCEAAALEVSSHALSQHRVAGCEFDVAIFTNLTRDHLDYHADADEYFAAKAVLFVEYLRPETGTGVLNADDPRCAELVDMIGRDRALTFSADPARDADVKIVAQTASLDGMRAVLSHGGERVAFDTRLVGAPNLSNLAAAAAAMIALGVDERSIAAGLSACDPVPGRLERVGRTRPAVFVDYAHTPDALERTLETVRDLSAGGRLIAVFGCGGDRDRGKRPLMGEIAGRLAEVAVVTSDNPRSEDPNAIIADIEAGIGEGTPHRCVAELTAGGAGFLSVPDRERAIRTALEIAAEGDVVVVAGKGHEDYQEVKGERRYFDDRALVARLTQSAQRAVEREETQ
jgi:UDP-N-acetylmuramoyl-L-alanyl-D-glutamate--2,6-diaminopimelate ligase